MIDKTVAYDDMYNACNDLDREGYTLIRVIVRSSKSGKTARLFAIKKN